jgi:hypothetical protein
MNSFVAIDYKYMLIVQCTILSRICISHNCLFIRERRTKKRGIIARILLMTLLFQRVHYYYYF